MRAGARALPLLLVAGAIVLACTEIPTGADEILSVQIDPPPSPSVIVGDTLRDSAGVVAPLTITAFNYGGDRIEGAPARFRATDRRVRVDSVTGIVVGDSVSATPSRILATLDGFSAFVNIPVVLRPDTVLGTNVRDSLGYSLADTAGNVSSAMGVRVLHGLTTTDSAVAFFRVTFGLATPGDTALARLVNDAGSRSVADTTDASGIASRRIRINVARLTTAVDSVVVLANVRYRGQHVRGSPVRLVLKLKPK